MFNRLRAMQRGSDLTMLQPVPFMPGVRPLPDWARSASHRVDGADIRHAPMFYVPGLLKTLDSMWLARAVEGPLRALHAERSLDLLDAHFAYPDGAGAVKVARALKLPVFITIRGFETEYLRIPRIREQILSALHSAAGVIAVSESLRNLVIEEGIRSDRVVVVQNAVDFEKFTWGPQTEARARVGVDHDAPLLVSVAQFIVRKRQHVLLDAFRTVREAIPDARLVLIGSTEAEPDYARKVVAAAQAPELEGSVVLAGVQEPSRVAEWLKAADLFVLPTAREGCCNAVLEALASGLPVVTTDVGDNARFVRPGDNGELVPVDDARALADAMIGTLSRSDWDRPGIASDLVGAVGAWDGVAARVFEFMRDRLRGRH